MTTEKYGAPLAAARTVPGTFDGTFDWAWTTLVWASAGAGPAWEWTFAPVGRERAPRGRAAPAPARGSAR